MDSAVPLSVAKVAGESGLRLNPNGNDDNCGDSVDASVAIGDVGSRKEQPVTGDVMPNDAFPAVDEPGIAFENTDENAFVLEEDAQARPADEQKTDFRPTLYRIEHDDLVLAGACFWGGHCLPQSGGGDDWKKRKPGDTGKHGFNIHGGLLMFRVFQQVSQHRRGYPLHAPSQKPVRLPAWRKCGLEGEG